MNSDDKLNVLQELFNLLSQLEGLNAELNYVIQPSFETFETIETMHGSIHQRSGHGMITINFNFIYSPEFLTKYGRGFFLKCIPTSLISNLVRKNINIPDGECHFEFTLYDLDESLSDISNIADMVRSSQVDKEMEYLLINGTDNYLDISNNK